MFDKTLAPGTIGIINQVLSASVAELGQVAERGSKRIRSLAFSPVPRRCARSISDPSLAHAFELPLALPVEALQQLRHQRFSLEYFVPSSPAKPLWTLPWMFEAHLCQWFSGGLFLAASSFRRAVS